MILGALALFGAGALAGCASSPAQVAQMQFSPSPPSFDQAKVAAAFKYLLKDPESARYEIGLPYRAYLKEPLIRGGGLAWSGWAVDVGVNAKNSFGGYTGFHSYHALSDAGGNALVVETVDTDGILFFRAN